jgi:hypothetical protein
MRNAGWGGRVSVWFLAGEGICFSVLKLAGMDLPVELLEVRRGNVDN